MTTFHSSSREETAAWAENYAKQLRPGDVVLLEGEMGAGKTVLAQGIARGLGIADQVTSPTYAYVNSYGGILHHFDCYRIRSERQAYELGLYDYFSSGAICLVEWSENIRSLLPPDCKVVRIERISDTEREITV